MIHRPSSKKEQLQVSLFSNKKCTKKYTKKCSCKEYFLKKRKKLRLQKEKMERELERERLDLEQEQEQLEINKDDIEDIGDEKPKYKYNYDLFNWLQYSSYPPLIYIPR